MAMILIETKEIEENGVVYIVETYQSDKTGKESVVKYPKPSEVIPEPVEPEPTPDPVMKKLDSIEAEIQTNEELQTFYDDIVKEVGL